jgi:hypothetical protein
VLQLNRHGQVAGSLAFPHSVLCFVVLDALQRSLGGQLGAAGEGEEEGEEEGGLSHNPSKRGRFGGFLWGT